MASAANKPTNWKQLRKKNLKLATSPLRLDRLGAAIDAPGCQTPHLCTPLFAMQAHSTALTMMLAQQQPKC